MSQKTIYKNKTYTSRSQCALAMIGDGVPQREVAQHLGISDQAVSAVKKRAERTVSATIRRAQRQADEAMKQATKLLQKANQLSSMHTKIIENSVRKPRTTKYRIKN